MHLQIGVKRGRGEGKARMEGGELMQDLSNDLIPRVFGFPEFSVWACSQANLVPRVSHREQVIGETTGTKLVPG